MTFISRQKINRKVNQQKICKWTFIKLNIKLLQVSCSAYPIYMHPSY